MLIVSTFPIPGNFKVMSVLSGSMEPAIKMGSIVVVKPERDYKIGDVITFTFRKNEIPITHRIYNTEVVDGEIYYITKGDANKAPDEKRVSKKQVVGKVLFSLPYLGFLAEFSRKPVGFLLLIVIPAVIIVYDETRKIIEEVKKRKKKFIDIHY